MNGNFSDTELNFKHGGVFVIKFIVNHDHSFRLHFGITVVLKFYSIDKSILSVFSESSNYQNNSKTRKEINFICWQL